MFLEAVILQCSVCGLTSCLVKLCTAWEGNVARPRGRYWRELLRRWTLVYLSAVTTWPTFHYLLSLWEHVAYVQPVCWGSRVAMCSSSHCRALYKVSYYSQSQPRLSFSPMSWAVFPGLAFKKPSNAMLTLILGSCFMENHIKTRKAPNARGRPRVVDEKIQTKRMLRYLSFSVSLSKLEDVVENRDK